MSLQGQGGGDKGVDGDKGVETRGWGQGGGDKGEDSICTRLQLSTARTHSL